MTFRRLLLALHRDLGYFFTGVTILYAVSGIAVNHTDTWNPHFVTSRRDVTLDLTGNRAAIDADSVQANLVPLGEDVNFRGFDFPSPQKIKIYLREGDIVANLDDGRGVLETYRRRPLLGRINSLHLHPVRWWKAFSDCFAAGLLTIAVTGILIARGRHGILGRGKWLIGAGLIVPVVAMLLF